MKIAKKIEFTEEEEKTLEDFYKILTDVSLTCNKNCAVCPFCSLCSDDESGTVNFPTWAGSDCLSEFLAKELEKIL